MRSVHPFPGLRSPLRPILIAMLASGTFPPRVHSPRASVPYVLRVVLKQLRGLGVEFLLLVDIGILVNSLRLLTRMSR